VDKAIDRFEQLIRINPRNQQAHFYLALGYFETGNTDKAREHFLLVKSMGSDQVLLAAVDGYLKEIN
jgi:cytochrome c-type biogenesis protein CcmH/NrfG